MTKGSTIRFYLDFASPYAYFAAGQVEAIAAEFSRTIEWRPILLWAVLKAHGIPASMGLPVMRAYLFDDMERSAAFFGLPYAKPKNLPMSSHRAARMFYAIQQRDQDLALAFAHRLLPAFFVEGHDISDEATLVSLATEMGIPSDVALDGLNASAGRAGLEAAVAEAIESAVIGSPYFVVDGKGFFGADRLPQLRWWLSAERT